MENKINTLSFLFEGKANEHLSLTHLHAGNAEIIKERLGHSSLSVLWSIADGSKISVDGIPYVLEKNQILCLTEFHQIEIERVEQLRMVRFNRPFYCILDHDSEVGCRGMLFFGAAGLPLFNIPEKEVEKFDLLWKTFAMEFDSQDNLQIEMLQMMLKRFLILCTRIYKEQNMDANVDKSGVDLIRDFNFQVEQHFRTKHGVSEYADLLHKSPKTLANYFSKYYDKTPLQIIQNRIMMEARKLLIYTEKSIKDITYELGFDNQQAFSRFFKSKEGISPSEFKATKSSPLSA